MTQTPAEAPAGPTVRSPLLAHRGAVAGEGADAAVAWHYGDPTREQRLLEEGLAVVDLSHRAVVTVTGPDAMAQARRLAGEIGALSTVSPPATPAELAELVANVQRPDGPLAEFVYLRAQAPEDRAEVQVVYRCWPPERTFWNGRPQPARTACS